MALDIPLLLMAWMEVNGRLIHIHIRGDVQSSDSIVCR